MILNSDGTGRFIYADGLAGIDIKGNGGGNVTVTVHDENANSTTVELPAEVAAKLTTFLRWQRRGM